MTFSVPTLVVSRNSGGSVTSTAGTFSSAVPIGQDVTVGISVSSDTAVISSVVDSKGNVYSLAYSTGSTTINRPVWIYKCVTTVALTTSDTLTVTIAVGAIINFIGVAYAGSAGQPFTNSIITSSVSSNEFIQAPPTSATNSIQFIVNGSAAPAWATATQLASVSGGGGPFFSCAYDSAINSILGATFSPNTTSTLVWEYNYGKYTDIYDASYDILYGQFSGTGFPSIPLALKVEILVNGTWIDITSYCYQRDGSVTINASHGRPDESSKIVTADLNVELNNRNGTFSSKNPSSPYYPYLTRNTQIRASVQSDYNGADAGFDYAFWGEVSEWPPSWDVTGTDIWTDIVASGITRRLNQQSAIGSALTRYYTKKSTSDPTYPIALWPCTDGTNSTQLVEVTGNGNAAIFTGSPTLASDSSFAGSDPIPVVNNSSWNGATDSFAPPGDILFPNAGSFTWVSPITGNVTAQVVGGGGGGGGSPTGGANPASGGGGGEYASDTVAVTLGTGYAVVVGAGGTGGTPSAPNGQDGGKTSFAFPSVVAHGGGYGAPSHTGAAGTGSTNTTHHNGGTGFWNSSTAGGGGSSGGSTAAGNNATNATGAAAPDSYAGVGGDGGGATSGGGGGGGTGNFTKTYTATNSYTYAGSDGTFPNSKLSTNTNMQQGGDVANTFNGKSKTWILFNYSQIAADLSGATITKVTLRLYSYHWWFNSGGTVAVGWDTTTSFPSTKADPSAHPDIKEFNMSIGQIGTFDIGTAFGTAFKSNSATSLVLFKNSNSLSYYGKFNGSAQANPPVLTIYYSK